MSAKRKLNTTENKPKTKKQFLVTSVNDFSELGAKDRPVNPTRLYMAWAAINMPSVQKSISAITRYLFADGIEILHGEEALVPKKDFQEHLMKYWREFGENALKWIFTAGVVPLLFEQLPDGAWIPKTAKPNTGYIRSLYKDNKQRFVWVEYGPRGANNIIIVVDKFGFDPDTDGNLTSIISSLLPWASYTSVIIDCDSIATQIRSRPPFVYQERREASKPGSSAEDFDYYAEYDRLDERNDQFMWRRDKAAKERLKMMNETIDEMYHSSNPLPHVSIDEEDGRLLPHRQWEGNEYYIPENFELVNSPMPQLRGDFINILKYNDDQVYTTFGVPRSMVTEDGNGRVGNYAASNDMFKTNIQSWKQKIGELLTMCYNIIYGTEDAQYVLKKFFDATKASAELIDEETLYKLQKLNEFRVNLPIQPFITIEELSLMWNEGAIGATDKCNLLRRRAGLNPISKPYYIPPRPGEGTEGDEKTPKKGKAKKKNNVNKDPLKVQKTKQIKEPAEVE